MRSTAVRLILSASFMVGGALLYLLTQQTRVPFLDFSRPAGGGGAPFDANGTYRVSLRSAHRLTVSSCSSPSGWRYLGRRSLVPRRALANSGFTMSPTIPPRPGCRNRSSG